MIVDIILVFLTVLSFPFLVAVGIPLLALAILAVIVVVVPVAVFVFWEQSLTLILALIFAGLFSFLMSQLIKADGEFHIPLMRISFLRLIQVLLFVPLGVLSVGGGIYVLGEAALTHRQLEGSHGVLLLNAALFGYGAYYSVREAIYEYRNKSE